jgi:hypothetical protein
MFLLVFLRQGLAMSLKFMILLPEPSWDDSPVNTGIISMHHYTHLGLIDITNQYSVERNKSPRKDKFVVGLLLPLLGAGSLLPVHISFP